MATTVENFKIQRPEFAQIEDAQISQAIEEAKRRLDEDLFGDAYDDAVSLQAAWLLAHSPQAQHAKLLIKEGRTPYDAPLRRLKMAYSMGHRVA